MCFNAYLVQKATTYRYIFKIKKQFFNNQTHLLKIISNWIVIDANMYEGMVISNYIILYYIKIDVLIIIKSNYIKIFTKLI